MKLTSKVISLNIELTSYELALEKIIEWSSSRLSKYICFANVHMIVEAYKDTNFALQVNGASLVLSDGVPVAKSVRFLYGKKQPRIAGMDVFPDTLRLANKNKLKVFFFGSTSVVLNAMAEKIQKQFPELSIAGMVAPPFGEIVDDSYNEAINASGAHLVFVALGCPKQEKWMAKHSAKIQATLLGVGGAFSVFAGITPRAPRWMQKSSLEWLYRLIQEPGRMWKRYLTTNVLFVLLLMRELMFNKAHIKASEKM